MKIYITGPVASGKSTLARRIAAMTGVQCYHLDEVMYVPDLNVPSGNRKRPTEEREALFDAICSSPAWVMEDTGRLCFFEGMRQADVLILLEPRPFIRRFRILRRWFRQRCGVEACSYRPNLRMLRAMYSWTKSYETGADGLKTHIAPFYEKVIVLRTRREVNAYIAKYAPVIQK